MSVILQSADLLRSTFSAEHPSHPLVQDVKQKAALFDTAAAAYPIPPLASSVSA